MAPETYEGVILSTQWSQCSECSVCDKVGRRHRYGICYVNLDQNLVSNHEIFLVPLNVILEYFCYTTQTFYEMYLPYVLQIADYLVDSEKTTARFKLMELDIKLIELFQGSSPTQTPFVTN